MLWPLVLHWAWQPAVGLRGTLSASPTHQASICTGRQRAFMVRPGCGLSQTWVLESQLRLLPAEEMVASSRPRGQSNVREHGGTSRAHTACVTASVLLSSLITGRGVVVDICPAKKPCSSHPLL